MKIGFIAMSGVRVQSAHLMKLGLTLPGFVERSKVIASLPSLGLLTLAGLTPETIERSYVEVPDLAQVTGLPGEFDAVAISSFSAQIKDAYRLADQYRAAGAKVILGGLHVTALPHEALAHADSVVLGEGELGWQRVLHDLEHDVLRPMYDFRGQSFDLANAPMPAYELLDISAYNRLTVQTQRGCPFSCEFCASSIRLSPKFKTKPIEKVIAEIKRIKSLWAHPFIEFADDNTFANPAHGKRLVRAIASEKIRWFTETDVSVADDADLLAMMRDSGCAQILVSLESPGRPELEGVETRSNWKARQADRYLAAIERIQSHGISVNGCFVVGLDGADADQFDDIARFVRESRLHEVQVTVQTPFPGTPLYDRLRVAGRLLDETAWERCTLFDVNFSPAQMSVAEFEQKFHRLVGELYSDESIRWRKEQFKQQLRISADSAAKRRRAEGRSGRL